MIFINNNDFKKELHSIRYNMSQINNKGKEYDRAYKLTYVLERILNQDNITIKSLYSYNMNLFSNNWTKFVYYNTIKSLNNLCNKIIHNIKFKI